MKLKPRLQSLYDCISEEDYQHIWDLCCDHGKLGLACRNKAPTVHLVELREHLCTALSQQLSLAMPAKQTQACDSATTSHVNVHHQDARLLMGADQPNQLMIIAGVGGDLAIDIIDAQSGLHHSRDFLICVNYHHYALREYLRQQQFALRHDSVIEDGKIFYEMLYVQEQADSNTTEIKPVGNFWQPDQPQQQRYLATLLNHYHKRSRQTAPKLLDQQALADYQALSQHLSLL